MDRYACGRYGNGCASRRNNVRIGVKVWVAALAGVAVLPATAHAQIDEPKPGQGAPASAPTPPPPAPQDEPIVPDAEFEASMPAITGDLNAPLDPLAPAPAWQQVDLMGAKIDSAFDAIVTEEPEFNQPLPALADFQVDPAIEIAGVKDLSLMHI